MADLLSIAQTGLRAAYVQLQTTGHNISNANTPGYVRQSTVLQSAGGTYTGSGSVGRGVAVVDIQRQYDGFLARSVNSAGSVAAGDQARSTALGTLDGMLSDTQNGLGVAVDGLRDAMADVVNRPADPSARQAVLARADSLANRVTTLDGRMADLDTTTQGLIRDSVTQVNGKLQQIGTLNQQIASVQGTDSRALDLVDQRDKLIGDVAGVLQVNTTKNGDGTVSVSTASGLSLVLGSRASTLSVGADPKVPDRLALNIDPGDGAPVVAQRDALGAGSLSALMQFRDDDLAAARAQVGQIAAGVVGAYNAQQALGVDAGGQPGQPLFALGAASSQGAASNTGNAALTATIVDPAKVQASDYTMRYDGSQYSIERRSDGTTTQFGALPATLDGLSISVQSGAMAAGDVVSLKTASAFSAGMQRVLTSGQGLATATAVSPVTGAANQGSVSVTSFSQTRPDANAAQPVTLTFTGAGTFSVSGAGTGNPSAVAYSPGGTVSYNGWSLQLGGTPAAGDTITLGPNANPAADNRNARAMVDLGAQPRIGGTATFDQAYAQSIADIGSRAARAQSSAQSSGAMLDSAKAAFDEKSGVNLDEEAAHLIQYQQAYQASAKVMATAQSLFTTVLNALGG